MRVEELLPVGYLKCMLTVDQLQFEGEQLAAAGVPGNAAAGVAAKFELHLIEHLDFDPLCECHMQATGEQCPNKARWNAVCTRCAGHVALTCEECRQLLIASTSRKVHVGCGFAAPTRDVVRFLPLGGA